MFACQKSCNLQVELQQPLNTHKLENSSKSGHFTFRFTGEISRAVNSDNVVFREVT